jgi:hypothetical protein
VLAVATGGLIALGTTPATAANSYGFWLRSSITSRTQPSFDTLAANTRSEADAKCFDHFKFTAREVKPQTQGGSGPDNWQMFWWCFSN